MATESARVGPWLTMAMGSPRSAAPRAYRNPDNTASDHESFADAGLPAARLGSTPYAAYHSAQDVPAVVDPAQLRRVCRVIWAWLLRAR